jgi:hypothetical protein
MVNAEIQENGKSIMDLMEPIMEALKKSKLLNAPKDEFDGVEETENEETPNE